MLFMILMIGKHPYAKVGGESPAHNIRHRDFPYAHKGKGSQQEIPRGIWGLYMESYK